MKDSVDSKRVLPDCDFAKENIISNLKVYGDNLGIPIPEKIDSKVYETIVFNKLLTLKTEKETDDLRNDLFKFSEKIRHIRHFFFHTKQVTLARLLGKLLTRIWWIYHTSSPLMKSWQCYLDSNLDSIEECETDSNEEYETDSDEEEEDDDIDDDIEVDIEVEEKV